MAINDTTSPSQSAPALLPQLHDLIPPAAIHQKALLLAEDTPADALCQIAEVLTSMRHSNDWHLGDLLHYAVTHGYTCAYNTVAAQSGLSGGHLRKLKLISERFPASNRTHELSHSHYAVVATYLPRPQETATGSPDWTSWRSTADSLLTKATQERWSVRQLEAAVRGPRAAKPLIELPDFHPTTDEF